MTCIHLLNTSKNTSTASKTLKEMLVGIFEVVQKSVDITTRVPSQAVLVEESIVERIVWTKRHTQNARVIRIAKTD